MTQNNLVTSPRAHRRVAAVLASLSIGAIVVVACSSAPDQPPLETSGGSGGGSGGLSGGSSSGNVSTVDAGGSSTDAGSRDATAGDGGERDATAPTESGLTQAFDASGFPFDANADQHVPCGIVSLCSTGCCDTTGTCQPGSANNACGLGGTCQNCTLDDAETCQSGACK